VSLDARTRKLQEDLTETILVSCDVIAACCLATRGAVWLGTAQHGEDSALLLLRSVFSVARRLALGYLAKLCCVIQQRVDLSQYNMMKA
jgi:hypothetical protein